MERPNKICEEKGTQQNNNNIEFDSACEEISLVQFDCSTLIFEALFYRL